MTGVVDEDVEPGLVLDDFSRRSLGPTSGWSGPGCTELGRFRFPSWNFVQPEVEQPGVTRKAFLNSN